MAGWTNSLKQALVGEFECVSDLGAPGAVARHHEIRAKQRELMRAIGRDGGIEDILLAEKTILNFELQYYANSHAMQGSLDASLAELAACERMLAKVRKPDIYKDVNDDHSLPKNRIGGLPRDEARQFFRAHWTRLLNLDKGRLDRLDKDIIDARRANIRTAEKSYIALQESALGITPTSRGRGRGAGLGM